MLQIPLTDIGVGDNFWVLGGNSIRAMRLAGAARRRGLDVMIADVWDYQSLEDMAVAVMPRSEYNVEDTVEPFSLLQGLESRAALTQLVLQQCKIQERDLVDIYPCTPLQEGLISLAAKRPSACTVCLEYELPVDIDIDRFRAAWNAIINKNPILRTRIAQADSGRLYQVVIRETVSWDERNPGQQVAKDWQDWKLGQRLIRFALSNQESAAKQSYFTLILHHAVSDGYALQLLLKHVEAVYRGASLTPRPFAPFIRYLLKAQEDAKLFWKDQFTGLNAEPFPKLPSPDYIVIPTAKMNCTIRIQSTKRDSITIPSKVKLAWAILVSMYTENYDVVFGNTVMGRGTQLLGIEKITGPTIATIPIRLLLHPDKPISDILHGIQKHSNEMVPFEQVGLQHMGRIGPEAASACRFQSLLVIQPEQEPLPTLFLNMRDLSEQSTFSSYAINVICRLYTDVLEIEAIYDPHVVSDLQLRRMLGQLGHIFKQIEHSPSLPLRSLDLTNIEGLPGLRVWSEFLSEQLNSKHVSTRYFRVPVAWTLNLTH